MNRYQIYMLLGKIIGQSNMTSRARALGATEVLAPNVPIWERPKKNFLNNFLEVILQKPCNTHRHEHLEKLLINNKCKTQF